MVVNPIAAFHFHFPQAKSTCILNKYNNSSFWSLTTIGFSVNRSTININLISHGFSCFITPEVSFLRWVENFLDKLMNDMKHESHFPIYFLKGLLQLKMRLRSLWKVMLCFIFAGAIILQDFQNDSFIRIDTRTNVNHILADTKGKCQYKKVSQTQPYKKLTDC